MAGAGGIAGCTTSSPPAATATTSVSAQQVVASLGAVPIPTPGTEQAPATARPGHPAVLAMGDRVVVVQKSGATVLAEALGPQQDTMNPIIPTPGKPPPSTPATIQLQVKDTGRTPVTLHTADLVSRDDTGATIRLTPVGASSVTVAPSRQATVTVRGTFQSSSAQVTWSPDGVPLAVWDFTIELD